MLYALGVGLGHDPTRPRRSSISSTRKISRRCRPSPPARLSRLLGAGPRHRHRLGADRQRRAGLTLHAPLKPTGTVVGRTRILDVVDKGAGKGALVYTERKITDKASGTLLATVTHTTFCRADGGFGGPPRDGPPRTRLPERAPDWSATSPRGRSWLWCIGCPPTSIRCTPISTVAKAAGFRGRSFTDWHLRRGRPRDPETCVCDYDPTRVTAMSGRFSAPVFPGETIRTEIWRDGTCVSFRALVPARNIVAMSNGRKPMMAAPHCHPLPACRERLDARSAAGAENSTCAVSLSSRPSTPCYAQLRRDQRISLRRFRLTESQRMRWSQACARADTECDNLLVHRLIEGLRHSYHADTTEIKFSIIGLAVTKPRLRLGITSEGHGVLCMMRSLYSCKTEIPRTAPR